MTEEHSSHPQNKPSKAERRRRIDIIESLLIDCATATEMKRYLAEKEGLRLSRRTIERYRELAEQRFVKTAEPVREHQIQLARLRLERCYARAITGGKKNVFAAIAAQKAINVLMGLNAPKEQVLEMVSRIDHPTPLYTPLYDGRKLVELNDQEFEDVRRGIEECQITIRDGLVVSNSDPGFLQDMHNEFKSMLERRLQEGELERTLKEMGYKLKAVA